ncbi:MAG TPA: DUF177 domain-containing protein [Solirubrobacteraceae bacterium]|nr:DUF177 domain-containing protein [Solirubrobacteraceae bacterium]
MPQRTDIFELERLNLRSGEGRRIDLHVGMDAFSFGGTGWTVTPQPVPVRLEVSRTTHSGYALRLRFSAGLHGACMRCLEAADPTFEVDAREVSQPATAEELRSPYVDEAGDLDLRAWARDGLALAVPDQITCRPDCAGLCPECGADLNEAGPEHHHERAPDPRWAKLRELKLD